MTDGMVTERQQETFSKKVSLQNLGSLNICVFCFLFLTSFWVEARREEMEERKILLAQRLIVQGSLKEAGSEEFVEGTEG